MKSHRLQLMVLVTVVLGVAVGAAEAQRRAEMTADMPKYDPATEETIQGIVVNVTPETEWAERTKSRNPTLRGTRASKLEGVRMAGTHVLLDTPDGDIEVHVAPTSFLASNGFEIARHEVLDVVGSRITVNGERIIVARDITQGGRTLAVRNTDGTPTWSQR
jgi:hypothetical protein